MSTSNMPARIWADLNSPVWSSSLDPVSGFDSAMPYIRADIVERMAEALADISTNSHHPWSVRVASAALTSYHEASNDKA